MNSKIRSGNLDEVEAHVLAVQVRHREDGVDGDARELVRVPAHDLALT